MWVHLFTIQIDKRALFLMTVSIHLKTNKQTIKQKALDSMARLMSEQLKDSRSASLSVGHVPGTSGAWCWRLEQKCKKTCVRIFWNSSGSCCVLADLYKQLFFFLKTWITWHNHFQFPCRFSTAKYPPLRNRPQLPQVAHCWSAARTSRSSNWSSLRSETATMSTSL